MGEKIAALCEQDGWRSEQYAARVHYEGATDRYSIEYYEPTDRVVYWHVRDDETAVPVDRQSVPEPLRVRIRDDLSTAGIDPDVERQSV